MAPIVLSSRDTAVNVAANPPTASTTAAVAPGARAYHHTPVSAAVLSWTVAAVRGLQAQLAAYASEPSHLLALILGPLVLILGYALLPAALFVCGFYVGLLVTDALLAPHSSAMLAVIGGIVGGALAVSMMTIGLFLIGVTLARLIVASPFSPFNTAIEPGFNIYVFLFTCAFGFATAVFQKPLLITATSLIGAAAIIYAAAFYLAGVPNAFAFVADFQQHAKFSWLANTLTSQSSLLTLVALAALTAFGNSIQYKINRNPSIQQFAQTPFDHSRRRSEGYQQVPDSTS